MRSRVNHVSGLSDLYDDPWWLERVHTERDKGDGDTRKPVERDRDRIVHSAALRRMANKTQVIGSPWSDDFRNRLTHTLEVTQIGRTIARRYRVDEALVEAACLGHDLGHPPFGHAGERKLNQLMAPYGGFDANAQTLRVLRTLEIKSSGASGLNLTRATLWSIIKYPYRREGARSTGRDEAALKRSGLRKDPATGCASAEAKYLYSRDLESEAKPGVDFAEWLAGGRFTSFPSDPASRLDVAPTRTLACQIMDWADDVAYAIHDFEDAVLAGFIEAGSIGRIEDPLLEAIRRDLPAAEIDDASLETEFFYWQRRLDPILSAVQGDPDPGRELRPATRELFGQLVDGTRIEPPAEDDGTTAGYRVGAEPHAKVLVSLLKHLGFALMIRDERVVRYLRKGTLMLERAFQELMEDPKIVDERVGQLLPRRIAPPDDISKPELARLVCDFLASMGEPGLTRFYQTVFESTGGSPLR
jgi:dGTPase